MKRTLLTPFLLALAAVSSAQTPAAPAAPTRPPVTLKVGDMAPPLVTSNWLKGDKVTSLADGKVHVVEFWATWCGPCRSSMPNLSALAEKYRGKVTCIGVNVWENTHSKGEEASFPACTTRATKFVNQAGKMMDYTVAMDTEDGTMAKTWLTASGQQGIPASYVVDGTGRILWIGHPVVGLDEAVALAADGKLDVESGRKISTEMRAKFQEFYGMLKTHDDQMKAKDYAGAIATADKVQALLPHLTDGVEMKLTALVHTDLPAARVLAKDAAQKHPHAPYLLLRMADLFLADDLVGATPEDAKLGLQFAKMATDSFGEDGSTLSTLALGYYRTGDKNKAVQKQQKYVDLLTAEPGVPAEYTDKAKQKLAEFQGKK